MCVTGRGSPPLEQVSGFVELAYLAELFTPPYVVHGLAELINAYVADGWLAQALQHNFKTRFVLQDKPKWQDGPLTFPRSAVQSVRLESSGAHSLRYGYSPRHTPSASLPPLFHQVYRVSPHLWQLFHNLGVRLRSSLRGFIGHLKRCQESQDREGRREALFHSLMLLT